MSAHDLIRREKATSATLAKFRDRAFDWAAGTTCAHLMRYHLRAMGHKVEPMPRIRSLVAAQRALKQRGWADCSDMLDGQPGLVRIAPAQMLLGDLAVLDSEDTAIGAVFVCMGTAMMLGGWHGDNPKLVNLALDAIDFAHVRGAWRV